MTAQIDTPVRSAKAILAESRDTIAATYWVKGREHNLLYPDYASFEIVQKAIEVDESEPFNGRHKPGSSGRRVKVTGVCSVGAITLANSTLYGDPLIGFSVVTKFDYETWKASAALGMEIMQAGQADMLEADPAGTIVAWNDRDNRARHEVVEMFDKAIESPLLKTEQIWEIVAQGEYGGDIRTGMFFADEKTANAFLNSDEEDELHKYFWNEWSRSSTIMRVRPHEHPALATTGA